MAGAARKHKKRRMEDTRERIARDIERTSESIRKKRRALKTGMIEEDVALERRFKPIVEPLKQIAEADVQTPIKREAVDADVAKDITKKRKKMMKREDDVDSYWEDNEWLNLTPQPKEDQQPNATFDSPAVHISTPVHGSTPPPPKSPPPQPLPPPPPQPLPPPPQPVMQTERVSPRKTRESSLETSLKQALQAREDREKLPGGLGPLGLRYTRLLLGDDRGKAVDNACGVYFDEDGMMLGDKKFDIDKDDSIIVGGTRYAGTRGLYELIFMKDPHEATFNEDDKQTYKSILLATNAHKHGYRADGRIKSSKGRKYLNIIRPLVNADDKKGEGVIPLNMRLTDNAIDYVHWDDPDELVDRLRLLDASHRAGNNAHDNEILSIIEELREAGLIIN